MRSRLIRLLQIVSIFLIYTSFKMVQLWPAQPLIAVLLTILFFVVMMSHLLIYRPNPGVYNKPWFRVVSWTGSLGMAVWATFVIISLPIDLVHLLSLLMSHFVSVPSDADARQALWHLVSIGVFGFSFLLVGIGFFQVLLGPTVKRTNVKIDGLAEPLRGLKIAQISDLHVGTTIRKGYVGQVVERTNALKPDLIFFTGDIADAHASSVGVHLLELKKLNPRLGSFYVTGNHEYYWNPVALIELMKAAGLIPLFNDNVILSVGTAQLLVGGVTDPAGEHSLPGHTPDAAKAIATNVVPDLKILLAHRPDACNEAEPLGFDLQFSGHTHAGQFFPFSLFIGLVHKYSRGLYRHGRMWVYVNPGTGYWGPADRLGVAPEISLVTLA
jgi:predicted MPP superfamily phosphohydrolase